ncbi:hypothetical protein AC792_02605 [Arthrobacter sp. RIT-PI-e]|uniref:DivIVA domain-containing protein n=1 Tax=Arthrobacter sp. RIT-PI-e TaxID=1681197 RepID=UPI000675DFED|nr:DivIVA domain-containing protein [Arthrobacter sp. RIT-PI-e]KNC20051.1 hypothetical protein AC792_02605 [Arthrobacter sp. RIT-PI-e]
MTVFLVILSILLLGGTALLASGRSLPGAPWRRDPGPGNDRGGDGNDGGGTVGRAAPRTDGFGLVEPVAGLPPVLLPEVPGAADVDAVRFGLGLRGYRMDQVDEVLDRLAAALEERDAELRLLRSQVGAPPDAER